MAKDDEPKMLYYNAAGKQVPAGDPSAVKQFLSDDEARPDSGKKPSAVFGLADVVEPDDEDDEDELDAEDAADADAAVEPEPAPEPAPAPAPKRQRSRSSASKAKAPSANKARKSSANK